MKWIYSSIIILLVAVSVSAQSMGTITYNVAVPNDKLDSYIDQISWRGVGLEGRWFQSNEFSFGVSFGWNVFDLRTSNVIEVSNAGVGGAVSGTQIRYVNTFPMLATGHYYIGKKRDQARFYLGAGVGTYYILQRLEIGLVAFESNNWHFGFAPEAGVLLTLSREVTMIFNVKYNYAFSSGEALGGGDNDVQYWGFNIGFAWQNW